MKTVKSMNLVNLPAVDSGVVAFTFNTSLGGSQWTFVMKWLGGQWNGWATLPSGEVRQFGCVPGVVNWSGFVDFGLVVLASSSVLTEGSFSDGGLQLVQMVWG